MAGVIEMSADGALGKSPFESARYLRRQGKFKEAAVFARRAIWDSSLVASAAEAAHLSRCWFLLGVIEFDLQHFGSAIDAFAEAMALNSSDSHNYAGQAMAFARMELHEKAMSVADVAVSISPDDGFVQNSAALTYIAGKRFDKAIACAFRAMASDPDNTRYWQTYAQALLFSGLRNAAANVFAKACDREPDNAAYRFNLAQALDDDCQYEAALVEYQACLGLDPEYSAARWNASLVRLLLGDYAAGLSDHETRFSSHPSMGEARQPVRFTHPQWTQKRAPERVHVHSEQGFGDTLQFCRYVPMIRDLGHEVRFEVLHNLYRLMAFNLPGVSVRQQSPDWPGCMGVEEFDSHLSLVSAAFAFKTTLDTIPTPDRYLSAAFEDVARFALTSERLRVGLCWYSGRRNTSLLARIGARKSLAFHYMLPILDLDGIDFHSLQIGGDKPGHGNLIDRTDEIRDFADTAGYIENLDLVISADTAVAHLAGAMGKPVWLLNPYETAWRWHLDRADSPWYSSMRIFRQPTIGDWNSVISDVVNALRAERH